MPNQTLDRTAMRAMMFPFQGDRPSGLPSSASLRFGEEDIDTMERSVIEVIMHSSPFAMLLLLASTVSTCVFVVRVFVGRSSDYTRVLTDAMLFSSVVAFMTFLLLYTIAQTVFGLTVRGIDADRPVAVAVENMLVYASIGSVMVGLMLLARLVKRR